MRRATKRWLTIEPALTTYRSAGFEEFAECRSVDYEARFKTPGLVFLRRAI